MAAGDSIAEVETDKATMDWESQEEGYIAAILADEGAKDIPVGTPMAVMVDDKVRSGSSYGASLVQTPPCNALTRAGKPRCNTQGRLLFTDNDMQSHYRETAVELHENARRCLT